MNIFNYHPETGVYLGQSKADLSPLEPNVWLIPAYATELEPPKAGEGQVALFNGTAWSVIPDHRGTYYDISSGEAYQHDNPAVPPVDKTKQQPSEVPAGFFSTWNNGWQLKEIPLPQPLTAKEKLAAAGLTLDDLKELLAELS
jgi:hypothetical protein